MWKRGKALWNENLRKLVGEEERFWKETLNLAENSYEKRAKTVEYAVKVGIMVHNKKNSKWESQYMDENLRKNSKLF